MCYLMYRRKLIFLIKVFTTESDSSRIAPVACHFWQLPPTIFDRVKLFSRGSNPFVRSRTLASDNVNFPIKYGSRDVASVNENALKFQSPNLILVKPFSRHRRSLRPLSSEQIQLMAALESFICADAANDV
jgi:hypothetical protein